MVSTVMDAVSGEYSDVCGEWFTMMYAVSGLR